MRYILIASDGELIVTGGDETAYLEDIGPEGPMRVPLAPLPGDAVPVLTGWVNVAGSPTYPLNEGGGQTLVNLGASTADYNGPVVVTGWDADNELARGINSDQSAVITDAYNAAQQPGG